MALYLNRSTNAQPFYLVDSKGNDLNGVGASSNQVQGNSAAGAADVGNPIKIGGVYKSALATTASGNRTDLLTDGFGNLRSLRVDLIASGTDGSNNDLLGFAQAYHLGGDTRLMSAVAGYVFNGTSWDRARGDINGTWMLTTGTTLGISDGAGNFITCPRTPIGTAIAQLTYGLMFNGTGWDRQRGDVTGAWVHAPQNTVSTALSGSLATAGATATVAFVNTARQEVINASTGTIWASWGTPAVNGAGSFPIAAGGSFSTDRTTGTLSLLSTAATQAYTVNRYA